MICQTIAATRWGICNDGHIVTSQHHMRRNHTLSRFPRLAIDLSNLLLRRTSLLETERTFDIFLSWAPNFGPSRQGIWKRVSWRKIGVWSYD